MIPRKFDPKDWEDDKFRGRLSSKQGLYQTWQWTYDELARHFYNLCRHDIVVPVPRGWRDMDIMEKFNKDFEFKQWCATNCQGYWMDSNFPHVGTGLPNLFTHHLAFEHEADYILFKLTWL